MSYHIICHVFHDMGLFLREREEYTIDDMMVRFKMQTRFRALVLHWLDILAEEGVLEKTEAGGYLNRHALNKENIRFIPESSKGLRELYPSLLHQVPLYINLLQGNIEPVELILSEDTVLTGEQLNQMDPGREYYRNLAGKLFSTITNAYPSDKKVKVLELGTRAGDLTQTLVSLLPPDRGSYLYTDESSVFADRKRQNVGDISSFEFSLLDMNKAPELQGYKPSSFDVIIADKTLHRAKHLGMVLKYVKELLVPGGLLVLIEPTQNSRLMMITVAFFEDGFSHFEDDRKVCRLPFIPVKKWLELLEKTGFSNFIAFPEDGQPAKAFGQSLIIAQAPEEARVFDPSNIVEALRQKLPDYMVPVRYLLLETLPLTSNMKLDRKALAKLDEKIKLISEKKYVAPLTEVESKIAGIWEEVLGHSGIGLNDNFFELGGDSLRAIQCINFLKEGFQVELSLQEFFKEANVERLGRKIEKKLEINKNFEMEEGEI